MKGALLSRAQFASNASDTEENRSLNPRPQPSPQAESRDIEADRRTMARPRCGAVARRFPSPYIFSGGFSIYEGNSGF
jgi:hypothetical protein